MPGRSMRAILVARSPHAYGKTMVSPCRMPPQEYTTLGT